MEAVAEEKDLYRLGFEGFIENRKETRWLGKVRRAAMDRFSELGFPTSKNEEWKYTNVAPIAKIPFERAVKPDSLVFEAGGLSSLELGTGTQIVFVDGHFLPELSAPRSAPDGVSVSSLREVFSSHPQWVEPHVTRLARFETDAFSALNTAFFEDGAFVRIPKGVVVSDPIHLVFFSTAGPRPTVSYPRNLIVAETGSQAKIVESYVSELGNGVYLTNAVTEILVGDGAVVEHYKMQRESQAAFHVASIAVRQDRSSHFTSHNFCFGGRLARNDIHVLLDAEGTECTLNGLFVGAGTQHIDNHTTIDHAKPHGLSRELYKGIMDGQSRGVFYGKIIVRPDAQKTDAMQTNKNLLLSKSALVNSTPALEIFADDVKCKHGSTIGQVDENALFYLRSRGIEEEAARALLACAFAADVASRIRIEPIRAAIQSILGSRLPGALNAHEAIA